MKTSLVIDPKKLALARKIGGQKTLRAIVDQALDAYISQARRLKMADLLGTDLIDAKLTSQRRRGHSR